MTSSPIPPVGLQTHDLACGNGSHMVLEHIDIDVSPGEFFALVGVNGCGKSTLIRALSGLRPLMAGSVSINGRDMSDFSARERGQTIAIVSQDEQPNADQRMWELVALGLLPYRKAWSTSKSTDRDRAIEALDQVGLADLADRQVGQTSGGELRRAILARALIQRSPLLFLDEPTNHLDIEQQLSLLGLVRSLNRTVIAAIHDLDLAAAYFDRAALIDNHGLAATGEPFELFTGSLINQAFQVRVTEVAHPKTGQEHLLFDSVENPRPHTDRKAK